MRTPLATMVFYLKMILQLLHMAKLDPSNIPQGVKYCKIVMQQTELLSSYVEDLLDLR